MNEQHEAYRCASCASLDKSFSAYVGRPNVILLSSLCHINLIVMRHNQAELNQTPGIVMIINWLGAKALPYLTIDDAELDELSVDFDFALSAEIMAMLYAQNTTCAPAETVEIRPCALDEHELALA